jgi:23S rRNA (guanosine2251-2'-O)-methyltransferase
MGSGAQRRKGLQPKGATPKAEERPGHPAARRRNAAERAKPSSSSAGRQRSEQKPDVIVGRNAVNEALLVALPARTMFILDSIEPDDRVRSAVALANKAHLSITVVPRLELDRTAGTPYHQGLALMAEPFRYVIPADLPAGNGSLVVALDHITDPHNLGAIARSAAAFGAAGLLVPQRRAAPVTTAAWKASAGALARVPVARSGNLVTALEELKKRGYFVIGLDGAGKEDIDGLSNALVAGPLVLVVGSEGTGLARLTAQTCDLVVRIPIGPGAESLNASVATGIALFAVSRRR